MHNKAGQIPAFSGYLKLTFHMNQQQSRDYKRQ